jgi:hypothetical protein
MHMLHLQKQTNNWHIKIQVYIQGEKHFKKNWEIVYCYISEERDALLNENDNWSTSDSELI